MATITILPGLTQQFDVVTPEDDNAAMASIEERLAQLEEFETSTVTVLNNLLVAETANALLRQRMMRKLINAQALALIGNRANVKILINELIDTYNESLIRPDQQMLPRI